MFRSIRSTAASNRRPSAVTRAASSVGDPPPPPSSRCQPSRSFHVAAQERQFLPRFHPIISPIVSACFSTEAALESTSAPTEIVVELYEKMRKSVDETWSIPVNVNMWAPIDNCNSREDIKLLFQILQKLRIFRLSNLRIHDNFNFDLYWRISKASVRENAIDYGDVKSVLKIEKLCLKTVNKHTIASGFSCAKKYRMYFPFANCSSIYFTSNMSKISPTNSNQRSVMTWSTVNEKEVTKALENFIYTAEDGMFSEKEMCNMYIEKLVRSGNLPDAAYLLDYLHNKQIYLGLITYNILLNAAGETNSFDLFAEIFKKLLLSRVAPDFTSYVNAAMVFRKMSDSNLLLKFIRDVSEITIHREPTVMNRIIYITAKSGQLDKSLMIFTELKKLKAKMDTVTFNTILVMLGRAGIVDQMLSAFDLMKDLGHTPDVVTYNTLINCLRRLGRLDMCKAFAKEMVERGINLDLRTYTALIDGLGRAGHVDDAMRIFSEMRKSHCPSVYVYRAMIGNLRKAGKVEAALSLLEDMNSSTLKLIGPEDFKRKKNKMKY